MSLDVAGSQAGYVGARQGELEEGSSWISPIVKVRSRDFSGGSVVKNHTFQCGMQVRFLVEELRSTWHRATKPAYHN